MAHIDVLLRQQAVVQGARSLKVRSCLPLINICSTRTLKQLWMWAQFDNVYDRLKKLKQGKEHFMTNCRVVALALCKD